FQMSSFLSSYLNIFFFFILIMHGLLYFFLVSFPQTFGWATPISYQHPQLWPSATTFANLSSKRDCCSTKKEYLSNQMSRVTSSGFYGPGWFKFFKYQVKLFVSGF
ncbi:MAG: hypothetical protein Q8830_03285, partial [Candidatus Phytoplasma australasiaticum]|nr:hypothetical protein [Candidatus Phytoplasma australasiaticum]